MAEIPPARESRALTRPLLVLAALALVAISIMAQLYGPIALLPEIAEYYGTGIDRSALVVSSFGFALAFGFMVFGRLSDKFGRRFCMVTGLVGTAIFSALVGFADDLDTIIWLRAGQGFFCAGFPPSTIAWLQERLPERLRYTGIAIFTCSLLLAGIVGQILASAGGFGAPPRWPTIAPAIFFLAAALLVALCLPGGPAGRQVGKAGLAAIPFRALAPVFVGSALSLAPFVLFFAAIEIEVAKGGLDIDPTLVRYAGLPGLLATAFAGRPMRVWGAERMALAGFGIMGAMLLAPVALPLEAGIYVAGFLFTFGIAFSIPALLSIVGSAAPDARALAISVHACVQFVGVALAPAAAEALLQAGAGLAGISLVGAGLSLLVVAVNWRGLMPRR
ncbi:MAG: MFS transporter [Rhodospirillales bacterium]